MTGIWRVGSSYPLARALHDLGVEVRVVAPSDRGQGGEATLDGVPVTRVTSGLLDALEGKGIEQIVELEVLPQRALVEDFRVGWGEPVKAGERFTYIFDPAKGPDGPDPAVPRLI